MEKIKMSDLKVNPRNPQKFNDLSKLEKSLKEFPKMMELRPLVIDDDGIILGGNKRLICLKKLGYKEIPKTWIKKASELTESEKERFIIADNVGFGDWDFEILKDDFDFETLDDWGVDLSGFDEIENLEAKEDDYEIPNEIETDIVLGDLFEIGEHRLLCGDSTDPEQVAKLMNSEKADSCITSPPYNQGGGKGGLFSHGKKVESLYENDFDNKTKKEYFDFCISVLNNISLILKNEHSIVWNVAYNAKSRDDYGKIIFSELNPFSVKETIIWNKGGAINLPTKGIYSRKAELIFIMSKYEKYLTSQKDGECRWNLWETKRNKQLKNHRATFPIEFAETAINQFTLSKNLIYEPFLGSGTTMIAAHQLNRKCYGMELDPNYCDVIIERMLKLDNTLTIKRNGKDETDKWLEQINKEK